MADRTPAQLYALVIGGTLVFAGIIGFFWSASFGDPGEVDEVLGLLGVNAWHNLVHIATGAIGLYALRYGTSGARTYAACSAWSTSPSRSGGSSSAPMATSSGSSR
jgi:Domain of unknown function (DUF4383)